MEASTLGTVLTTDVGGDQPEISMSVDRGRIEQPNKQCKFGRVRWVDRQGRGWGMRYQQYAKEEIGFRNLIENALLLDGHGRH